MSHEPFVIERTYNAPVSKVWRALTDKEQMKAWYFDIPEFKAEEDFEFRFYGHDDDCREYLHLCKVLEVIPDQRLSYSWQYENIEGYSTVTLELFEDGDKTRLRLTHKGIESFPSLPAFMKASFAAGWTEIMGTNLKAFLETDYIKNYRHQH